MNKTICPICRRELNSPLRPDFLLCPDCQIAVRVSGTLAKEADRLNVYNPDWVEEHSNNPIAKDIARHTAQVVNTLLNHKPYASVVDIGCGSGLLVDRLTKLGYSAYGVDWSEPAIWYAQKHHQGTFTVGDVDDVEAHFYTSWKPFNCIVASHILEHLENPHEFLESVKGLLKPDGYLVIAVPNLDWWDPKSVYRSVSTIFDAEHAVGYSPKGLRKLLEGNGYRVVDMLTRTHRLAIMTALGITAYRKLFGSKEHRNVKSGYVKATREGVLAKVLAWGITPLNRLSERGLKGMELIVVAKRRKYEQKVYPCP